MNSYVTLIEWLKDDLGYYSAKKTLTDELKSRLSKVLEVPKSTDLIEAKIRKEIQKAIHFEGFTFQNILRDLYLQCFFSPEVYIQNQRTFVTSSIREVISKRIKTINYPQTLAFGIFFSDRANHFSQIERASVLISSSLRYFLREIYLCKNKINKTNQFSNYIFGNSFCFAENKLIEELLLNLDSEYILVSAGGQYHKFTVIENGNSISVDRIRKGLERIISEVKEKTIQIGAYSAASKNNRYRIRTKYSKKNNEFFKEIEKALFTVCLDLVPYGENIEEEMFSQRFGNRYFGNTQLIIGTKGESAAIISYAKIDGIPAIEAFRKIYIDSNQTDYFVNSFNEVICTKIPLQLEEKDYSHLQKDVNIVLHEKKSSFYLDLSTVFFKKMNLSANITLNFLLMLATYDITQNYPVINHAVSRLSSKLPNFELDWVYVSPKQIEKFHQSVMKYPEIFSEDPSKPRMKSQDQINGAFSSLERRALLHRNLLINQGYGSTLADLEQMLRHAISDHAGKIRLAREGLSPTFLLHKPQGAFFNEIVKFYLHLGTYAPAYRNYLFRACRNPQSIDVMTSSLKLPPEIKTLGRHGSCSDLFSCYGLHILFKEGGIELVFIPNKNFVDNMQHLVDRIQKWLFVIKAIIG